jgi:hypothetical protein
VNQKLTTAEITIVVSGAVTLVFSFVKWFGVSPFTVNGWDNFPLFAYAAICGLVMAAQVLATRLGNLQLPNQVLGFTWPQIHLVLGLVAVLDTLGVFLGFDHAKIGLVFSLIGSIGLLAGAVMLNRERSGRPTF